MTNRFHWTVICMLLTVIGCTRSDDKKSQQESDTNRPPAEEKASDKAKAEEVDNAPLEPDEAQDALVGIWRIDLDRLKDAPEIRALSKDEREAAIGNAKRLMSSLAFEFAPDGKMKMFMGSQIKEGTYQVLKSEGNTLHIETKTGKAPDLVVEKINITVESESLRIDNQPDQDGRTDVVYLERGAPGPPEVLEAESEGTPAQ